MEIFNCSPVLIPPEKKNCGFVWPGPASPTTPSLQLNNLSLSEQAVPSQVSDGRLARNRRTARLRRERKKKEAEDLTSNLTAAALRNGTLRQRIEALPEDAKKNYEIFQTAAKKNQAKIGCLFCDFVFDSGLDDSGEAICKNEIIKHYKSDHPHDLKTSKAYLGDHILPLLAKPYELLSHVEKLSEESCQKANSYAYPDHHSLSGYSETNVVTNSIQSQRRLSLEEKRRRRLERNAESARLCRQRKKLYMQKIRLKLPQVEQENELMAKFLQNHADKQNPKLEQFQNEVCVEVPRMTGWDRSKKPKRNLSFNRLADTENLNRKRSAHEENGISNLNVAVDTAKMLSLQPTTQTNLLQLVQLNNVLLQAAAVRLNHTLGLSNLPQIPNATSMSEQKEPEERNSGSKEIFEAAFALTKLSNKP